MSGERQPSIQVKSVQKRYGAFAALSDVTFDVGAGTLLGVLGPSGSGKTTLIRIIAGLLAPSSGEARVFGHAMPDRAVASRIGYMPQNYALYSDLTVKENLEFYAGMYGVNNKQAIDSLIEQLDLTTRSNSSVYTLSGGERRRTSLAAALVNSPDLLLLDEPTVGLDPRLRVRMWERFRTMVTAGDTLLISSHVMDEMERCDRVLLISEGRLIADGSPSELKTRAGVKTLEEVFLVSTDKNNVGKSA